MIVHLFFRRKFWESIGKLASLAYMRGGKLWSFVILYLKEFDQSLRGHSLLAAIFRPKGLAACVFGAKNREIPLFAICVFSPFFIFFEWQLARARFFVPTGICKALFRDSASVLNAFWPARIVVACFGVFRGEIFYGCQPMIFPGFSGGGLPTIVLCTNWRQESLVRGYG